MTQCTRCLLTDDITDVGFDSSGVCNFCHHHDAIEAASKDIDFNDVATKIRYKGRKKKYDCLIPISGGMDSSILLYLMVEEYNLRPLVIHFDNFWNTPEANNNIEKLIRGFGLDCIRYYVNEIEMNALNKAFLKASVSEADIPNDLAMADFMRVTCKNYGIKYILNGHNFREEGTTPLSWTYMDSKYVESVYSVHNGGVLRNFPLLSFSKQLLYALRGIQHINPLYYVKYDRAHVKNILEEAFGWQDYGSKHAENDYTWFVASHILPNKFGIDKRLIHLSALVRSGYISKEFAESIMDTPLSCPPKTITEVKKRLGISTAEFNAIMKAPRRTHHDYDTYHPMFRKYRWLMWILMKINAVPYNFYKKYCR